MRILSYLKYKFWDAPAGMGKPVPREVFDRDYVEGKWKFLSDGDEIARLQMVVNLIAQRWSRPSVLDVGSGSGQFASMMQACGPESFLGIDLSETAVEIASRLSLVNTRFEAADFESWPVPSQARFDAVIFNESIGYAKDPLATLLRYTGSLRPEGAIIVSLYQSGNSRQIWRRISRKFDFPDATVFSVDDAKRWDVRILRLKPEARP